MARPVVGAVRGVHASSDDGPFVHEDAAYGRLGGLKGEFGHGEGFAHESEVDGFLILVHSIISAMQFDW